MIYVASYVAALVFFLVVDVVWIGAVTGPLFERHVADLLLDEPRLGPAAGFYAFYVAGVLYLAVAPALKAGSWRRAAFNGAVVGFLAYGAYDATNLATLKGWTWGMLAVDVAWGTVLTGLTALVGYLAHRRIGGAAGRGARG